MIKYAIVIWIFMEFTKGKGIKCSGEECLESQDVDEKGKKI